MIGVAGASRSSTNIGGALDGGGMTGVLPLYVLLEVMRRRWKIGDLEGAVALAKVAAPYLHGKAPSARPEGDLAGVTDEELERVGWEAVDGGGRDGEGGGGGEAAANENTAEPG